MAAAEFGGWWPMSPWLSPGAAWFIFFNVVVGAIAVMSRGQDAPANRRRLSRTASTVVLDSLRSISLFSFHSAAAGAEDNTVLYYSPPATQQLHHAHQHQDYAFQEPEAREAISRAPPPPELREPDPAPAVECENMEDGESISLDEAYALARARRESPTPAALAAAAAASTVAKEVPRKKREPVKLAEVKGRYACGRGVLEEVEGKAEVNARAEQFIRQFREDLKLERINSILNYTRALRRGGAGATTLAAGV